MVRALRLELGDDLSEGAGIACQFPVRQNARSVRSSESRQPFIRNVRAGRISNQAEIIGDVSTCVRRIRDVERALECRFAKGVNGRCSTELMLRHEFMYAHLFRVKLVCITGVKHTIDGVYVHGRKKTFGVDQRL